MPGAPALNRFDLLAFSCIIAPQVYIAFSGPPPLLPLQLSEPSYVAHFSTRVVTAGLLTTRLARLRPGLEQLQLTAFLAGMPVIYFWAALLRGTSAELGVEALGVVLFGAAAALGYLRASWLVGAAIGLHGVAWDAFHHSVDFIPHWYVVGCLLVDLGFAVYAFLLLRRLAPRPPN